MEAIYRSRFIKEVYDTAIVSIYSIGIDLLWFAKYINVVAVKVNYTVVPCCN